MQKDRVFNRLYQAGGGAVAGVPLIEIIADRRVLIENHHGVYRYTREQICIQTKGGMIKVDGKQLFLEKISKERWRLGKRGIDENAGGANQRRNARFFRRRRVHAVRARAFGAFEYGQGGGLATGGGKGRFGKRTKRVFGQGACPVHGRGKRSFPPWQKREKGDEKQKRQRRRIRPFDGF